MSLSTPSLKKSDIWLIFFFVFALGLAGPIFSDDRLRVMDSVGGIVSILSKNYGGNGFEQGIRIVEDDGYVFAGNSKKSFTQSTDWVVGKLNYQGEPLWALTIGGTDEDFLESMIQTKDKGILLLGGSQSPFKRFFGFGKSGQPQRPIVMKLDPENKLDWAIQFEKYSLSDMQETVDGNVILVGQGLDRQFLVVSLSSTANINWSKTYLPTDSQFVNANRIIGSPQHKLRVLLQATTDSTLSHYGFGVVELDGSGEIASKKFFFTPKYHSVFIRQCIEMANGALVLVGDIYGKEEDQDSDICVISITRSGQLNWAKVIQGVNNDQGVDIGQVGDQLLLTSMSNSPQLENTNSVYFLMDLQGRVTRLLISPQNNFDCPNNAIVSSKGVVAIGSSGVNAVDGYDQDMSVLRLDDWNAFKKFTGRPFLVKDLAVSKFNINFTVQSVEYPAKKIKTLKPRLLKVGKS
jgi:hypothetical protein